LVVALAAGLGLVAAVPTPAAEEASAEQIKKLIEQLGSDNFGAREQASKQLDEIGVPALEALRQAAQGRDAETRRRAEELVQKIEKRGENARLLAAKRLHLVYKDTPLPEAVADFARKSGYNIALLDPLKKLADRKVTLDTGETTFWEAFDQFCEKASLVEATAKDLAQPPRPGGIRRLPAVPGQAVPLPAPVPQPAPAPLPPAPQQGANNGAAGVQAVVVVAAQAAQGGAAPAARPVQVQVQPVPGQVPAIAPAGRPVPMTGTPNQITLVDGKPQALPTCYSGAVRIQALRAAGGGGGAAEANLTLQVSPEPKMQWQSLVKVAVDKAVDDQGKELTAMAEANPADPNAPVANVANAAGLVARIPFGYGAGLHQMVPLRLKKAGEAKTLKQLEGTITAQVWGEAKAMITVDDVLKAAGKTIKGADGGFIKVIDASRGANGSVKVKVELEAPPGVLPAGQFAGGGVGGFGGVMPGGPIQVLPIQIQPVPLPAPAPPQAPPPAPNGLQFQQAQPAVQQVQIQFAADVAMPGRSGVGLTLVDDKGQQVQPTGFQQQITRGPNGISTQLTLTFPPQKGEAAKLVFSGSRSATLEIPFKLKDVPLP
jgi:hypothetical protein